MRNFRRFLVERTIDYSFLSNTSESLITNCLGNKEMFVITELYLVQNNDVGCQTDLILLDFDKAFDKVNHLSLLKKLAITASDIILKTGSRTFF